MPYGRYPERVKDFRKWSTDRVDKAKINDSATGSSKARSGRALNRRFNRRRRKAKKEEG